MTIQIAYLADHPEFLNAVAIMLKEQWGNYHPERALEDWKSELHSNKDKLPLTLIALEEEGAKVRLVATAALRVGIHKELGSFATDTMVWLERVYVTPEARHKGIALLLINECIKQVEFLQVNNKPIRMLSLLTRSADGLYKKLGWKEIGNPDYKGGKVSLMIRMIVPKFENTSSLQIGHASWWSKASSNNEKTPSLYSPNQEEVGTVLLSKL